MDDADFRRLMDKVDDLATGQAETQTALKILVGEVKEMRDKIEPVASCQERINRLCTEHDQRADVVRNLRSEVGKVGAEVTSVKQNIGLRPDGTSKIDDMMTVITTHKVYFAIMGIVCSAIILFVSGIGQAAVRALLAI